MQQPASSEPSHQNEYKVNMKKSGLIILTLALSVSALAQTADRFEQRYDLLVSQFGPAGVGVETVLDNWEKVDSTSYKLLYAKFAFYFTKSQTAEVVTRKEGKYLGMDPMLTLKDSLGNDLHYYQVNVFDDELYGKAMKSIDKAIALYPDMLDNRFLKANAYIAYEKESPDMALPYLLDLAGREAERNWEYEGVRIEDGFFEEAMQEYCYSFYSIGTPPALEAFLALSQKLAGLYPDYLDFMNNIGSYHMLAAKDYKAAIKQYGKVLKKDPTNYTAIKNSVLASRRMGNVKSEKKFLQMLAEHGPEKDRLMAEGRLKQLSK